MGKVFFAWVLAAVAAAPARAADLTPLEQRFVAGIAPVIAFARETKMPLDIVVQPQPTPGLTPLGMAFVDGRCKLVLSMRGNPKTQATLDRIDPALLDATLELMAAHELGHCQRYVDGVFDRLPAGFNAAGVAPAESAAAPDATERSQSTVRREEAYGDLVGLAWTRHRHAGLYASLHAWLVAERSSPEIRGSDHDTRAWLALVRDASVLADPSIFRNATAVWARGLHADD